MSHRSAISLAATSVRGYEVHEASNGLEAVALWETVSPHLLVLDLMMPPGSTDARYEEAHASRVNWMARRCAGKNVLAG